jgi:dipeptidyl aminopeptidase/acylaminoacyl peptidase
MLPSRTILRVGLASVAALLIAAVPAAHAASHEGAEAAEGMTLERLFGLRWVSDVAISPDGSLAAYTLRVPRDLERQEDGPAWSELWIVPTAGGEPVSYVRGEVNVKAPAFTPDGKHVTYLAKRDGDENQSLWALPVAGGESRRVLAYDTSVASYDVSPDGQRVAFVATAPLPEERKQAEEEGFDQVVFEEDWMPRQALIAELPLGDRSPADPAAAHEEEREPRVLETPGSAFAASWSQDGRRLVLKVAPRPLIDDRYMNQRVVVFDLQSDEVVAEFPNIGKLGPVRMSPDGQRVAMLSAADRNDPSAGQLLVGPASGGERADMLPDLEGHVSAFGWRDAKTLVFLADVGVETRVGLIDVESREVTTLFDSAQRREQDAQAPVFTGMVVAADGNRAVLEGSTWRHPTEVYALPLSETEGAAADRLTRSNPWLSDVAMAPQEVVRYEARDGLEIEGLLIRPLATRHGDPPPLMLVVHGGPEAHYRNGWMSYYSRPGQVAAAQGYAVFYPNYRGSTGRGVRFSKMGQGDAAGAEFDDLIDGVDHLVEQEIADGERVGVTGGSYGGYATAWLSTRHTERFAAGVMFVGISNKMTKALTTEIPIEDWDVHTLYPPWTKFDSSLERSPISHVAQARTPLLIAGGTADSRVHPSQSLQFYRALELIDETPVRYVRYPGEGHGNRDMAARQDYARRLMRWMDHFVVGDAKTLPPWSLER